MAITVGLDFGTHQTKICIENSDDPRHVTYKFMEWPIHGMVLPSIVQINKDHTVAYGVIDESKCLTGQKMKDLIEPQAPKLEPCPEYPFLQEEEPEPLVSIVNEDGHRITLPCSELYGIGKEMPAKRKEDYAEYHAWLRDCQAKRREHSEKLELWKLLNGSRIGKTPQPKLKLNPEPILEGYDSEFR